MKILRSYLLMMSFREVLGEVICKILRSWTPINNEVFLADSILYPIELHIHCLGFSLFYSSIGDSGGVGIVVLNGHGQSGVYHFSECDADNGAVLGVVEEASVFGFGSGRHNVFHDVANGVDGTVRSQCRSGRLCWVVGA